MVPVSVGLEAVMDEITPDFVVVLVRVGHMGGHVEVYVIIVVCKVLGAVVAATN